MASVSPRLLLLPALALLLGGGVTWADSVSVSRERPRSVQTDAHEQLRKILDQPLYQRWKLRQQRAERRRESSPYSDMVQDAVDVCVNAIGNVIRGIFSGWSPANIPSLGDFASLASVLKLAAWIVLVILVVFLAVILVRAVHGNRPLRHRGCVISRQQVRRALEEGEALALNSTEWLDEARRLSNEHEFRALYRALYLALLSGLHEVGKIDYRRHRTNWTYVVHFNGSEADRGVFRELTALFDEVWYGLKPPGDSDVESVRRKIARLIGYAGHPDEITT